MKCFVIDIDKCNGCHNCQIVCKDEHCGNEWEPYTKPQPDSGQFWCKVEEKVRGSVPFTRISYIPHLDGQDEAVREFAPEVMMDRSDGLVVIDPTKAKGRKDIADKFDGIYWNEEFEIPQGCTGCAHLLDNGWTVPRCVDACATEAIRFGDEEEFADELKNAVKLSETSHVYYLNYPKRFVGGTVIDPEEREVIIGAEVFLKDSAGEIKEFMRTDEFGDFIFKQVEPDDYIIEVKAHGFGKNTVAADCKEKDVNAGVIKMHA